MKNHILIFESIIMKQYEAMSYDDQYAQNDMPMRTVNKRIIYDVYYEHVDGFYQETYL